MKKLEHIIPSIGTPATEGTQAAARHAKQKCGGTRAPTLPLTGYFPGISGIVYTCCGNLFRIFYPKAFNSREFFIHVEVTKLVAVFAPCCSGFLRERNRFLKESNPYGTAPVRPAQLILPPGGEFPGIVYSWGVTFLKGSTTRSIPGNYPVSGMCKRQGVFCRTHSLSTSAIIDVHDLLIFVPLGALAVGVGDSVSGSS